MVATEMCRQTTANLVVIVAQCPLSCQTNFLEVANNFSFPLIDFRVVKEAMNVERFFPAVSRRPKKMTVTGQSQKTA